MKVAKEVIQVIALVTIEPMSVRIEAIKTLLSNYTPHKITGLKVCGKDQCPSLQEG